MRKVALKVAYIGTDFYGFQRQKDVETVEGKLIEALKAAELIDNLKDSGYSIAGRTDRGVHALGNVISFRTSEKVVLNQINDYLPKSIRIIAKAGVPFGFKPRFAKRRHYRYITVNSNLNINKMENASKIFEGTHNFSNFSKRSERNPVRTIDKINVIAEDDFLIMDVFGESFLWNMVRKIASVLFSVGRDELDLNELQNFFDSSFKVAIAPMQAEGLILMDTIYANIKFKEDEYAIKKFISILNEEYRYNRTLSAVEMTMINVLNDSID